MKKTFTFLIPAVVLLISASSFVAMYSTGIAGKTGSPGENTCGECHGGGSSAAHGITVTSVPAFSLNQYLPDSTYDISIQVSAISFTTFGFGCEILDSLNKNAGLMSAPGPSVQFMNAGQRRNATHTSPQRNANSLATFSFKWKCPAQGKATIYIAANAVNRNSSTSGDFPLPKTSLVLYAKPKPKPKDTVIVQPVDTTSLAENINNPLKNLSVYPQPSRGLTTLVYSLNKTCVVKAEIVEITGRQVKVLFNETKDAGAHDHLIDLHTIPPGVYFIKLATDNGKVTQKMLTVM